MPPAAPEPHSAPASPENHGSTPLRLSPPTLSVAGLAKSFAGVPVLTGVSLELLGGEVHTLMGENGAGKSTLMKILAGIYRPDAGELRVLGDRVSFHSPKAAQARGIALIHQEPLGYPDLSVTENLFLPEAITRRAAGQIDWPALHRRAAELLSALGADFSPRTKVGRLSIADRQLLELAGALSRQARVLLMDEPTASLTPGEVDRLFTIVRRLRADGVAVVFVSHRLPEVFEISDKISVLRDGQFIGTRPKSQTTPDEIIAMMVGRELGKGVHRSSQPPGDTLLEAQNLSSPGRFQDVSLSVRAGEIVALAGLVGAGRTEVAEALFGIHPPAAGTLRLRGKTVRISSPTAAKKLGLAYVPEDRQAHGLVLPMSLAQNTTMASLAKVSRLGWHLRGRERARTRDWIARLAVRSREVDQPARELSGGNQQKIVLAKWLETDPTVLILDEPTRGVDVGAKAEIHQLIADLAAQGKGVLMISSDLPEVLALADRIVIMRNGRVVGELPGAHAPAGHNSAGQATQEGIMALATGTVATVAAATVTAAADPTVTGAATASEKRTTRASRLADKLLAFREIGIAAVVVIGFAVVAAINPRILSADSLRSIALSIPLIIVIAMGQMLVIVSRNIDLSVGSTLAFAAMVVGMLFRSYPAMPIPVALLIAAGVGAALGAVNGILVALLRVPAIIATLGTLTAYRGAVFLISGGKQVDTNDLPPSLIRLSQTSPIGIPWIILFAAAIAALTSLWVNHTKTGREIFAMGSNPLAAELRGIPVRRNLLLVFTLTGLLSGVAGLMAASRFGFVNSARTGDGFELVVISAVVIGGVNVLGGAGSVTGVVLGSLLLGLIYVALPLTGVSPFWQLALYGLAILVAATADTLLRRATQLRGAA